MSRKAPSVPIGATGIVMDAPYGREVIPGAGHRLHGADRSGLGQDGWAEVPEDRIGHPDDTNVPPEFYEPQAAPDADGSS